VHTADVEDHGAVPLLLEGAVEQFPRIAHLWVDQTTRGVAPIGSRRSSAGMRRLYGIRHNHAVNGCNIVIGATCGPSGFHGNDWHQHRRYSAECCPAGSAVQRRSGSSPGSARTGGSAAIKSASSTTGEASIYCSHGSARASPVGPKLTLQNSLASEQELERSWPKQYDQQGW
jgi:hypothetical protein